MSLATDLRKQIACPEIDFDFWVRVWRDGTVWTAPCYGTDRRSSALRARLAELGYETVMDGKPGTSGHYVIDIITGPGIPPKPAHTEE